MSLRRCCVRIQQFWTQITANISKFFIPDFGFSANGQTATSRIRKLWSIISCHHLNLDGMLTLSLKTEQKYPVSAGSEKWALARRLLPRISRVETCNFDSNYFQSNRIFMRLTLSKWSACGFVRVTTPPQSCRIPQACFCIWSFQRRENELDFFFFFFFFLLAARITLQIKINWHWCQECFYGIWRKR